ncbi:MAG: hypothetical protein FD153_1068 [Rhodospirillaceae bacterium]|nr:MAG: hypothetical protein FD153_1068 [Rhodospirillaceae bacterium]
MACHQRFATPPTLVDLDLIARQAFATLPEVLRRHLKGVIIQIAEFCDAETEEEMDLENPFELLGLYQGTSLPHKSAGDIVAEPDMIFLYRRPILDYWCETGEDLGRVVRHVLIHEIGHHLGFSDEEMNYIETMD